MVEINGYNVRGWRYLDDIAPLPTPMEEFAEIFATSLANIEREKRRAEREVAKERQED